MAIKKVDKNKSKGKTSTTKEAPILNINRFIEEINKEFGVNALMLGKDVIHYAARKIPTGSISLDLAMGGGVPVGRFLHLSGLESTFKSTIMYHIIANAQKMGMPALITNSESGSFTFEYGEYLGIDVDNLLFNPCGGLEEALEIAHSAQKAGVQIIGIDSLESLTPMKEYASAMDDTVQMGIKPKILGEYFRKFSATNNILLRKGKTPCTVIGINQLREKIGSYGDPFYTPGGHAATFAASIEARFRKGDLITIGKGNDKYSVGQTVKFKISKNKVDVPLKTGSFDIYFDDGGTVPRGFVDNEKEIVTEAIAYEIIEMKGAWLSYKDIKAQGVINFIDIIREDKALFKELHTKLMEVIHEDDVIEDDLL